MYGGRGCEAYTQFFVCYLDYDCVLFCWLSVPLNGLGGCLEDCSVVWLFLAVLVCVTFSAASLVPLFCEFLRQCRQDLLLWLAARVEVFLAVSY